MATRQALEMDDEPTRLANRAAALAFASAFAIIVGLVALPGAVRPGEPVRRVAALVASVVAIGVTAWAWKARVQLGNARAAPAPGDPRQGRGAGPTGRSDAPAEPVGSRQRQPSGGSGATGRIAAAPATRPARARKGGAQGERRSSPASSSMERGWRRP